MLGSGLKRNTQQTLLGEYILGKDGIAAMIPADFKDFFAAGTGAGAALIGLLFVAIAVAPERFVMGSAPSTRRAVASSSFTAFLNAFFISFRALLPTANMGRFSLVMSVSYAFLVHKLLVHLHPLKSLS
jgi:hypothetical protein